VYKCDIYRILWIFSV